MTSALLGSAASTGLLRDATAKNDQPPLSLEVSGHHTYAYLSQLDRRASMQHSCDRFRGPGFWEDNCLK